MRGTYGYDFIFPILFHLCILAISSLTVTFFKFHKICYFSVIVYTTIITFFFSYSDSNQMMSSAYMRYADDIDNSLKNQPHQMVKHCLLKKSLGENLDPTGIKVEGIGKFSIKYYKNNEERNYNVSFSDDDNMPNCSCPDWKSSAYPCKHFFAIFKKFPCWNWNSLSSLYRNSPYLNLDLDFLNDKEHTKQTKSKGNNSSSESSNENDFISNIELTDLPVPKKRKRTQKNGESIRSLLNTIRSLSFLVENDDVLIESTHNQLSEIINEMEEAVPKESGVPLLPKIPKNVNSKIHTSDRPSTTKKFCFKKLPIPKRRNTKFKRVGEKKEKLVQASQIKIEEKIEVVEDNIETEQILEEINYDDIKVFNNTNQQTAQYINISSDDEENNFDKKSHNNLTSSRINLSHKDLKNISNQEMLTDNVIHVFQNMIKKQNTDVNGLQDPVLGETLNFFLFTEVYHLYRYYMTVGCIG